MSSNDIKIIITLNFVKQKANIDKSNIYIKEQGAHKWTLGGKLILNTQF